MKYSHNAWLGLYVESKVKVQLHEIIIKESNKHFTITNRYFIRHGKHCLTLRLQSQSSESTTCIEKVDGTPRRNHVFKLIQQPLKPGQDKIKRSTYKATHAVFQFHYRMLQTHSFMLPTVGLCKWKYSQQCWHKANVECNRWGEARLYYIWS